MFKLSTGAMIGKPSSDYPSVTASRLRVVLWPTFEMATSVRVFDELDVWTEGAQARTTFRASFQHVALAKGFAMLQEERIHRLAVTLSFGTIERNLDAITDVIEDHLLLCHRLSVVVRGDMVRIRSPYRVQGFLEWLRIQHVGVGYRLDDRIDLGAEAVAFVEPRFVKLLAPTSVDLGVWEQTLAQALALDFEPARVIVAGLDTPEQKQLALDAGFVCGQGMAVAPWQSPPSIKQRTLAWPDMHRPGALR